MTSCYMKSALYLFFYKVSKVGYRSTGEAGSGDRFVFPSVLSMVVIDNNDGFCAVCFFV